MVRLLFWASPTNGAGVSNPSGTDDMPAGNGRTGGVNLQNPSVPASGYLPFSGQAQWFDNTGATYTATIGSEFKYRSIFYSWFHGLVDTVVLL